MNERTREKEREGEKRKIRSEGRQGCLNHSRALCSAMSMLAEGVGVEVGRGGEERRGEMETGYLQEEAWAASPRQASVVCPFIWSVCSRLPLSLSLSICFFSSFLSSLHPLSPLVFFFGFPLSTHLQFEVSCSQNISQFSGAS